MPFVATMCVFLYLKGAEKAARPESNLLEPTRNGIKPQVGWNISSCIYAISWHMTKS